jgi:hypothetical protein
MCTVRGDHRQINERKVQRDLIFHHRRRRRRRGGRGAIDADGERGTEGAGGGADERGEEQQAEERSRSNRSQQDKGTGQRHPGGTRGSMTQQSYNTCLLYVRRLIVLVCLCL